MPYYPQTYIQERMGDKPYVAAHVRPYPDPCVKIWTQNDTADRTVRVRAWMPECVRPSCGQTVGRGRLGVGSVPTQAWPSHMKAARRMHAVCLQDKVNQYCNNEYLLYRCVSFWCTYTYFSYYLLHICSWDFL